jgi:NADH dehydrogenase FAD-containing subunit
MNKEKRSARINAETIVWAAGVKAASLADLLIKKYHVNSDTGGI